MNNFPINFNNPKTQDQLGYPTFQSLYGNKTAQDPTYEQNRAPGSSQTTAEDLQSPEPNGPQLSFWNLMQDKPEAAPAPSSGGNPWVYQGK